MAPTNNVITLYASDEREALEWIDGKLSALDGEGRVLVDETGHAVVTERRFLLGFRASWLQELEHRVRSRHPSPSNEGGQAHG